MENNNNVAAMNELLEKAITHLTNEDYEIAIDLFEQAYKLQCEALSENDPDTLKALNNLAACYEKLNDYENAIELYEKCYELRCEDSINDSINQGLILLSNYSFRIYKELEDYDKAFEILKEYYKLNREAFGEKAPDSQTILSNLTACYCKSIELLDEQYQLQYEELKDTPIDDSDFFDSLLKSQFEELKEDIEAFNYLRSLKHTKAFDTLYSLITDYYKLATSYKPMGDEISKGLLEKIYALNCKAFGERSFAALKTLEALAATYGNLGNHEKKRELKEIIESAKHSTTHIYLTKNTEQLQIIAFSKKLGDKTLISARESAKNYYNSAREKAKNYKFDDNGKLIVDITYQEAFDAYEKTIEYYTMAYRLQFLLYGENEHPEVKGTLESLIKAYKELLPLENTFESLLREYKGLIKVGSKSYSALEERLEFYQAIFDEIK